MDRSLMKWSPSVGCRTAFVTQGMAWGDKTSANGEDEAPGGVQNEKSQKNQTLPSVEWS
jgi:hypothetical protein